MARRENKRDCEKQLSERVRMDFGCIESVRLRVIACIYVGQRWSIRQWCWWLMLYTCARVCVHGRERLREFSYQKFYHLITCCRVTESLPLLLVAALVRANGYNARWHVHWIFVTPQFGILDWFNASAVVYLEIAANSEQMNHCSAGGRNNAHEMLFNWYS